MAQAQSHRPHGYWLVALQNATSILAEALQVALVSVWALSPSGDTYVCVSSDVSEYIIHVACERVLA